MDTMIGPKLTDAKFFGELIDCTLPGLEGVPAAAAAGDYAACRKMFGDYVRAALDPDTFFTSPYEFPENAFTFKGETEEEAAERIAKLYLISCGTPHQFEGKVDWFANPTFNQYKEWTWQLSRHSELIHLAKAYRATGDQRYADGAEIHSELKSYKFSDALEYISSVQHSLSYRRKIVVEYDIFYNRGLVILLVVHILYISESNGKYLCHFKCVTVVALDEYYALTLCVCGIDELVGITLVNYRLRGVGELFFYALL